MAYRQPWGRLSYATGAEIINFPQQHYDRGVAKNTETGRRFKAVTRILKSLRYAMQDRRIASAAGVQSFELESLVWNAPTALFGAQIPMLGAALYPTTGIREPLKGIMRWLYASMGDDQGCSAWKEVNGIKPLFGAGQPWTRQAAQLFLNDAWNFAELDQ
jgi:hypothetical protein